MKKFLLTICAIGLVLALCSCDAGGFDKKKLQLSEYDGIPVNDPVQMYIKQRTVTDATEELALYFENTSDREYTYDAGARLEVRLDDNWYLLPHKFDAMTMEIYHLPADSSAEGSFVLAGNYDKLPEGSYRIVKLFVETEGVQSVSAAEFTIGRG